MRVAAAIRANSDYSAEILAGVVASRAIRPEDLFGACLFLASEAAAFITGQILVIDGGATFH